MAKILVIDDDAMMLHTISKILMRSGHEVIMAEDGVRGIAAFRRERPDLVITDIIMPDQEGIGTITQIRREARGAKIIAVSGGGRIGNAEFLDIARALGANDTLAKPFRPEELLGRVKTCLAQA